MIKKIIQCILITVLLNILQIKSNGQCFQKNIDKEINIDDDSVSHNFRKVLLSKIKNSQRVDSLIEDYSYIIDTFEVFSRIKSYGEWLNLNLESYYFTEPNNSPNAFFIPKRFNCESCQGTIVIGRNLLWNKVIEIYNTRKDYSISRKFLAISHFVEAIIGHEIAHAFQFHNRMVGPSKLKELHADFFGGYITALSYKEFGVGDWYNPEYGGSGSMKDFYYNETIFVSNEFFEMGDNNFWSIDHHGTPQERLSAFREGFKIGIQNDSLSPFKIHEKALLYLKDSLNDSNKNPLVAFYKIPFNIEKILYYDKLNSKPRNQLLKKKAKLVIDYNMIFFTNADGDEKFRELNQFSYDKTSNEYIFSSKYGNTGIHKNAEYVKFYAPNKNEKTYIYYIKEPK